MPRQRVIELTLLFLVGLILCSLYALSAHGSQSSIPTNVLPFLLIILGLLAIGHSAIRLLIPTADGILFPIAGLLNGIGYVFIVRLDSGLASNQAIWTAIAMSAFVLTIFCVRNVLSLRRHKVLCGIIGLSLLMLPLLPYMNNDLGKKKMWIQLGDFSIQPAELAKVLLPIFFASYLIENRELLTLGGKSFSTFTLPEVRHLRPLATSSSISLLILILYQDPGFSLIFFFVSTVLLWVASNRLIYLSFGTLFYAIGAIACVSISNSLQGKISVWLSPWDHKTDAGYQILQSTFALASGGLTGTGPGVGSPQRIPEVETDFIFAVLGEELGLMGATAILISYLLIVGLGCKIAIRAHSAFETILAVGLTTVIGAQAAIVIAGVLRLSPLTELQIPFLAYGPSSLVSNYIIFGILLKISQTATSIDPYSSSTTNGTRSI